jgi:hypothetical protein
MRLCRRVLLVLAAALASGLASAQPLPDSDRSDAVAAWRALAQTDLDAAYRLIRDNHPGAARELGDSDFQQRLENGYALARSRLAQVQGYNGYAN